MKQQPFIIVILFSLSAVLPFMGCGQAGKVPGLVKCEGTVRWNDTPVEGAHVIFHSKASNGRGGVALTDANGKFKMMTLHTDDGIEPGEYIVTVSKITTVRSQNVTKPAQRGADADAKGAPKSGSDRTVDTYHIPQVYSNKETSGLSAIVPAKGTKDLLFELVGEISK